MFRCSAATAAALLVLSGPSPAAAWGPDGHTIVAHIADSLLDSEVEQVLTTDLDGTSLTDASTWCDDFDHSPEGKWSEALHYINYPGHACSFEWERDCKQDWCNAGAIENYTKQIFDRSSSKETRLTALKFVIHMAGDVHQPLHVASDADRGGNDIKVHLHFEDDESKNGHEHSANLHAVWDAAIILQDLDEQGRAANNGPTGDYGPTGDWQKLADTLKTRMKGEWSGDVSQWQKDVAAQGGGDALHAGLTKVAGDTASLGCEYAYVNVDGTAVKSGDTLNRDYFQRVKPIVESQLAKGGARLAQLLKDALVASGISSSIASLVI